MFCPAAHVPLIHRLKPSAHIASSRSAEKRVGLATAKVLRMNTDMYPALPAVCCMSERGVAIGTCAAYPIGATAAADQDASSAKPGCRHAVIGEEASDVPLR